MIRVLIALLALASSALAERARLLNVSYDPTREFYQEYNAAFAKFWKAKTGDDVRIQQSHGGSGKQARSVIDGLPADVVTLALGYDIDVIAQRSRMLPTNWQSQFPHNSAPFTSTIVFLVRKGNPKAIKDWDDLTRGKIAIEMPNPKTSGGARWIYLAAWAYAEKNPGADAKDFMRRLYANAETLHAGARGALTAFVQRGMGDVLLAWETEALLAIKEYGADKYEIVYPSLSILAEPPVAVVERVAKRNQSEALAKAYLEHLYSEEGQALGARHFYRPRLESVGAKFPAIKTVSVEDFGGWAAAQRKHFDSGGTFDQIFRP